MKATELYRTLHTGNPGDVEFYERVCQGASRVLELGCGWGRISIPLARRGLWVVGVDDEGDFVTWAKQSSEELNLGEAANPEQLPSPTTENPRGGAFKQEWAGMRPAGSPAGSHANGGSARFIEKDVSALPRDFLDHYRATFDRVLLPYNTVYALGGKEKLLRTLTDARACMRDDSELWLDVYDIDELHQALLDGEEIPPDDDEPILSFDSGQGRITVTERTEFEVESRNLRVVYEAKLERNVQARLEMIHHYFSSDELIQMLEQCGFSVLVCTLGIPGADTPETRSSELEEGNCNQWFIGAAPC